MTNQTSLSIMQSLGLTKGLTARLDPPRVSSQADMPPREVARQVYAAMKKRIHADLFLNRRPYAYARIKGGDTVTFYLFWPKERPFGLLSDYEVWAQIGASTILVDVGAIQ
jgi:hypothetical protein